jgi:hypothetical protein
MAMSESDNRTWVQKQLVETVDRFGPLAADRLELTGDDKRMILTELCIEMFNAGVRAGATQAIAQAVEQGADVTVNLAPELRPHAD